MIDQESVAVVVTDDDRRYVHANPAACELLGIAHDELIGMRTEEVTGTPPGEIEGVWARFREAGVLAGTFPLPSPVGPRNVPYIAVADVTPGRHLAIFLPTRSNGAWQPLSQREREVVALVAGGATGREVGEELSVTSATVETHIRNAMRRLGARNRSHLVTLAILRNEIEVDELGWVASHDPRAGRSSASRLGVVIHRSRPTCVIPAMPNSGRPVDESTRARARVHLDEPVAPAATSEAWTQMRSSDDQRQRARVADLPAPDDPPVVGVRARQLAVAA